MNDKEKLKILVDKLKEIMKESAKFLDDKDTDYRSVLNQKDTEEFGEVGEYNNFEAGRISAVKEALKEICEGERGK